MEAPEVVPCPWFRLDRRLISAVSSRLVMMSGTDFRSPWSAGTPMVRACPSRSHPLPPIRGRRGLLRCASASARSRRIRTRLRTSSASVRELVLTDHPVVVHRVEIELGGVNRNDARPASARWLMCNFGAPGSSCTSSRIRCWDGAGIRPYFCRSRACGGVPLQRVTGGLASSC